jgi:hypothetical protein
VLTNRRERWELFDVGIGIQTQPVAFSIFTLSNPTTMQQPMFKIAVTKTKNGGEQRQDQIFAP